MFTKRVNETKCIRYTVYKDTYIRIFRIDMVKGYREPVYTNNIFVSEPCRTYIYRWATKERCAATRGRRRLKVI